MEIDDRDPTFACKCLNVRLYSFSPPQDLPVSSSEIGYEALYVGDDGIAVVRSIYTAFFAFL